MLFRVKFADSRLKIFNFVFVFKAKRKALEDARVMVAFPKGGTKKARSEKTESQLEWASVGWNDSFIHSRHTSMQNDGESMEKGNKKLSRLHSFQPVEKQASNYFIENTTAMSSSEMQTSDVKPKDKPWPRSKEFVKSIYF